MFLKVSSWEEVIKFGKKGKLSPRFIRPYEVIKRIGPVAYKLLLPPKLAQVHNVFHNVFHVSMLRCYRSDPSHILKDFEVEVEEDMSYEEELVCIVDARIKQL